MTDDAPSDPAPAHGPPARARVITGQVALSRRTPVVRAAQTVSMRQGEVSGRIALNPSRERIAAVKAMLRTQDHAAAEQALQALLADHPTSVAVRQLQAQLHFLRQRWEEAEAIWRTLVAERPDEPHLRHDHAAALSRLRRFGPARDAFRALLQRWPDFLLARLNLGALLRQEFQRPSEALEVMEPALARHGDHPPLHFNIGRARQDLLDTAGAIGAYRQALEHDPGHLKAFSAHMFCSHYLPTPDLAALRDWAERHGQALRRPPTPAGDRVHRPPGPRLRVGLLSGDLSDHPVAYFLESVLRALHGRGVELVAYATHDHADAVTRRLRRSVTTWRLAEALTDAELARQIADDRLDVLLDLAGFTNHSRLGVLLMRPAPLQVSWLGYFGTQGVPEIDAVVADPHCVPADEQRFFTERLLHMPHTRLCMSPPVDAPEPAPEPPLASGAALRFACLQNLHKINARVLDAWRRILLGAPGATLLIQGRQIGQSDVRARFEALLDASGIDRSRVRLRKRIPRGAYLAQYGEVDLLLDTFPYPGGTTTAEAIWMGVPTLTLATPGMLGRQGQALLHQVGLDDWVTHSDDDYVRRAIALANDREGTLATLRHLRRTLRETARRSPLFDAECFAHDFEALLRRACAARAAGTPL
jgi:protein O-GlcNAc transferase